MPATLTITEETTLGAIILRAVKYYAAHNIEHKATDIRMDLVGANDACPLDFERLADFDDGNFMHDIGGINQHLDHATGELRDCFVPRCAKPSNPTPSEARYLAEKS